MKLGCLVGVLMGVTLFGVMAGRALGCEGVDSPCPSTPFWLILPAAITASLLVRWLVGRVRR